MSRTYVVRMPRAEAQHLAGIGMGWPATPAERCVHAMREWLYGIRGRMSEQVPVQKILDDLEPLLSQVPLAEWPQRGPFAGRWSSSPLPCRVEYIGDGAVRLDDAAISALAQLHHGDDFRVTFTDVGPVLTVGDDHYLAFEEGQEDKP